MRLLNEESSTAIFIKTGAFHEAMLSTEPQFAHLEESFKVVQNRLKHCEQDLEEAELLTMRAMAKRTKCDCDLDNEVRMLELDLLHYVKKDRGSTLYKNIFEKPLNIVVSMPVEKEIEAVKLMEAKLSEAPQEISKYRDTLKQMRESLQQCVDAYKQAVLNENEKRAMVQMAKNEWLRQYSINYAELLKVYPREKWRVETFFKKTAKSSSSDHEENETQNQ